MLSKKCDFKTIQLATEFSLIFVDRDEFSKRCVDAKLFDNEKVKNILLSCGQAVSLQVTSQTLISSDLQPWKSFQDVKRGGEERGQSTYQRGNGRASVTEVLSIGMHDVWHEVEIPLLFLIGKLNSRRMVGACPSQYGLQFPDLDIK